MTSSRSIVAPLLTALFAAALLATLFAPSAGAGENTPAKVKYKLKIKFDPVAEVRSPTVVTSAPGFKKLVYVTSRHGTIRVIRAGRLLPRVMLDISDRVNTLWVEQGLLGLAFAPDFKKSGRYYIHYTARSGDIMIDEYRVDPDKDPTRTLPGSGRNVLRIPRVSESGNHNGGPMAFLGNYLYISIGDGNDPGDKLNVAQNLESLRGKLLRIDPRPDQTTGRTYRIPPDNPFVGRPGRDEIFAYGFRNPHSFDFFKTSKEAEVQLVITDVGQSRFEEMNVLSWRAAWGSNFGWKMFEGLQPYSCGEECPNGAAPVGPFNVKWPVLTYSHKTGCAIIGGPYMEDPSLTTQVGRIIYGDFCANRIRSATPSDSWIRDDRTIGSFMPPGKGEHPALNGFGEDGWGRVYAFSDSGSIYRLDQVKVRVRPKKVSCKKNPAQKRCKKKAGSNG